MHPVLLEMGDFRLFSYPFFWVLGFILGTLLIVSEGIRLKISAQKTLALSFEVFLIGSIGARIFYALGAWKSLGGSFVGHVFQGGLVFYGGLITTLVYLFFRLPKASVSRAAFFSAASPGLCLGHAIGRIGCFLNGCCFGDICTLPWAVPSTAILGEPGYKLDLHPSQLYEFIFLLFLCTFLLSLNRNPNTPLKSWRFYLYTYPTGRFLIEFTRGDPIRGIWGPLSTSQWISLGIVIGMVFLDLKVIGEHKRSPNETRN